MRALRGRRGRDLILRSRFSIIESSTVELVEVPGERYCPRCASQLEGRPLAGRERPVCPNCGHIAYKNPAVGVAVIVRDDQGGVLLGRRTSGYAGKWCIPCGYVEWDEDVRDAARREFAEDETNTETTTTLQVHVGGGSEKLGVAKTDLNERIAEKIEEAELDPDQAALLDKLLGKD